MDARNLEITKFCIENAFGWSEPTNEVKFSKSALSEKLWKLVAEIIVIATVLNQFVGSIVR